MLAAFLFVELQTVVLLQWPGVRVLSQTLVDATHTHTCIAEKEKSRQIQFQQRA